MEVVPLVILQLHDIPQFCVWNDLSSESFDPAIADEVSTDIFLVLLDHVLKEVFFFLVQLLLITIVFVIIRQTEEVVVALTGYVFFDEKLGARKMRSWDDRSQVEVRDVLLLCQHSLHSIFILRA